MMSITGLRAAWVSERPDRCQEVIDSLSPEQLADLGTATLDVCVAALGAPSQVAGVLKIGRDRQRWTEAHLAFDQMRDIVLQREAANPSPDEPDYCLLFVAENTARLIYNATSPADPFDADSGAWLLVSLAQVCRSARSAALLEAVWKNIVEALTKAKNSGSPG